MGTSWKNTEVCKGACLSPSGTLGNYCRGRAGPHPDLSAPEPALGRRARRRHPPGSFWREHLHSRVPMRPDPGLNQRPSILLCCWGHFGPLSYASSQTAHLHDPTQAAPASSKQRSLAPNDHQCEKKQKKNPNSLICAAQTTATARDALEVPVHGGLLPLTTPVWHGSTARVPLNPNQNEGEKSSLPPGRGACNRFGLLEEMETLPVGTLPRAGERAVSKQGVLR